MSNGRKVSTDALETLGTIIDDTQKRDAIHIAVLPVEAAHKLKPGQDIGIRDGLACGSGVEFTGIVDPFLDSNVAKGQHFWMLLYPRMVTSLRHVWSHPAFADDVDSVAVSPVVKDYQNNARRNIQRIADDYDIGYDRLIQAAHDYVDHGDYILGGSELEGESVPDEFWGYFEIVTGRTVPDSERGSFFSCSC